ncbi:hypothetical protein LOK49_LG07G02388, partial [Camellia lanceoleosa]
RLLQSKLACLEGSNENSPKLSTNHLMKIAKHRENLTLIFHEIHLMAIIVYCYCNARWGISKEAWAKAQGKWANSEPKKVRPAKGPNRLHEGKCLNEVTEGTLAAVKLLRHFALAPPFPILSVPLPSEVAKGKRKPKQLSCRGNTCDGQVAEALCLNALILSIGRRKLKQLSYCDNLVPAFCRRSPSLILLVCHLNLPQKMTATATIVAATNVWREYPAK